MAIEFRGEEILYVIEAGTSTTGERLLRPFNQTGGSTEISADTIDMESKDKSGADYGKVSQTVALEGVLTEKDETVPFIITAMRTKQPVKIFEVNTRTKEAESGLYTITSFNMEYSNGDFATYSLEGALNGDVAKTMLTTIPGGAAGSYDADLSALVQRVTMLEAKVASADEAVSQLQERTAEYEKVNSDLVKTVETLGLSSNFRYGNKGRAIIWLSTHPIENSWFHQLSALTEAGVPTIFMSEAWDFLQGKLDLPPLAVVLRADDAPLTWYTRAYPALKKSGHKLTMYFSLWHRLALTEVEYPTITDEQIIEMVREGVGEIQYHSGPEGHTNLMPIGPNWNATTKVDCGYYVSNRKWLLDEGRAETDAEFKSRIDADLKAWLRWYNDTIVPVNGGTTLHFAPPNGEMGADGVGKTRSLLIDVLKENNILSSTWKAHNVWMSPGFRTTDGGISTGQLNCNYDMAGLDAQSKTPEEIREFIRVSSMSYMPETYFASKFDRFPSNTKSEWYVQNVVGGDVVTRENGAGTIGGQDSFLKVEFGASTTTGSTFWKRTLPADTPNTYLQVKVGIPSNFTLPSGKSLQICRYNGSLGQAFKIVSDSSGVLTAQATTQGATPIVLGSVEVPSDGVNWYTLESHVFRDSEFGIFEGWFNNKYVSGQSPGAASKINTAQAYSNELLLGKTDASAAAGLSGSIYFARVVLDDRYVGDRGVR